MTGAQLGVISVIVVIFSSLIGVYYLAKSSAREAANQRQAAVDKAVSAALQPVQAALAAAVKTIDQRDATLAAREARIDSLEDELRRGRGYGDDNAARQ